MENTKIIIILVIFLVISFGVYSFLMFKAYQSDETLNKDKQLGMSKVKEVIQPEVDGNVIISRQLGYKFTIPEGFVLDEIGTSDTWDGDEGYVEIRVLNPGKQYFLNVGITPMNGDDFINNGLEFNTKALCERMLELTFADFDKQSIIYKDFCGLPCAYYEGKYILNKKQTDETDQYMETYQYLSPYINVTFFVLGKEEYADEMSKLFNCFEELK